MLILALLLTVLSPLTVHAGEKEYDIWKTREGSGVPINESVQGEINAVRDELGLDYIFPWEDGYKGYTTDRKIKAHIER